jgi:diguanylate cyclase (GGDEF)-like protein/PAS domain S-box-containing protein
MSSPDSQQTESNAHIEALERKNRLLQEGLKQAERIRELWGKAVLELKLTKADLQTSRTFLDRVLGAAPEPIVVADPHGRIVLANTAAERFMELPGLLVGKRLLRLLPRSARRRALERFNATVSDGVNEFAIPVGAETRLLATEWSVLRDGRGRLTQIIVAGQDVTERRRAEQRIVQQSEELKAINANLSLLYEVSSAISHTMDIDVLYADILKILPQVIGVEDDCERGIFLLGSRKQLRLAAHWGAEPEPVDSCGGVKRGECLCGQAAQDGKVIVIEHCETAHPCVPGIAPGAHGHVIIPLKAKGEVIGIFYFYLPAYTRIDESKTRLLIAVGEQVGVAIENVRLYEEKKALSLHDPLTGLANRRHMEIALSRAFSNARRYRSPLAVIMLDIDFFKKYNDAHGHQAGDHLLSVTAQLLSHQIRDADMAARYGGEEFLIILPGTESHQARVLGERIRRAISAKTGITVSMGIADMSGQAPTKEDLIQQADEALYRAKQNGRDRIEIWSSESASAGVQ